MKFRYLGDLPWSFVHSLSVEGASRVLEQLDSVPADKHDQYKRYFNAAALCVTRSQMALTRTPKHCAQACGAIIRNPIGSFLHCTYAGVCGDSN